MSAPSTPVRQTLAARLRSGPLSIREATQICRALLSTIETAHARGTAHGPITPGTIILEAGRPILDAARPPASEAVANDLFDDATVVDEWVSGRPATSGTDPGQAEWSGVPRRLRRRVKQ